ncbi:unnamed protein product [Prorocentrum cordatum]|uniref:Uncharacterized protein n=1 Tax=Prorocentrum cordatum TaxID=2364126 RepID=A0ABN9VUR5_9DINO|nr:unnamed protein product [Polarella glacialis]
MHPHLRHGHPAVLGSNRLLWKRFPHTGGRLYIWLPWPQGRLCWLGVTAVGLLIVADAVCVLTWFQERGLESRIEADDQRSCPSPSSVARDRDSPRKALSDAPSRGGRAFLLERLSVRLVLDPDAGAAGALQAGQRTWRRVRASFEDAPGDLAPCPSLASSLTLWAAIVAAGDEQDEQLVERADVEPEDAECAWRVSFTPRESRAYDLHVRALWVNATAEPAYGTCDDVAGKGGGEPHGLAPAGEVLLRPLRGRRTLPRLEPAAAAGGRRRMHAAGARQQQGARELHVRRPAERRRLVETCLPSSVPRRLEHPADVRQGRAAPRAVPPFWGSPAALGTPRPAEGGGPAGAEAACGAGGPGPGACEYGRRPGRWRFAGRAPNWTADWEPDAGKLPAYTRDEVGRCWQSRGITKIAMTGDSLIREQFNGLRSYVEENFEVKKVSNAHFWWRRPDGVDVSVEFIDFFSFFREISMLQYGGRRILGDGRFRLPSTTRSTRRC